MDKQYFTYNLKYGVLSFLQAMVSWNAYLTFIYLFKVNNGNTRTMCEVYSKLITKRPERNLLSTLNKFHTLFWCFNSWFWTIECRLCKWDLRPKLNRGFYDIPFMILWRKDHKLLWRSDQFSRWCKVVKFWIRCKWRYSSQCRATFQTRFVFLFLFFFAHIFVNFIKKEPPTKFDGAFDYFSQPHELAKVW